ncbi:hypothetical protein BDB01DRAFT_902610 [Pilobolus umbonatus]|nr:hypothetical protein BDB01DRAFT_902610 [Pilobolus umbonatus]
MKENTDTLIHTIITYTKLLKQSDTPSVATWQPAFIERCIDWCVFIESELTVLKEDEVAYVLQRAKDQSPLPIPPLSTLLDALHSLFKLLLQNVYMSHTLYLYILEHYQFLTHPESDILIKDLTSISRKIATENILKLMLDELK